MVLFTLEFQRHFQLRQDIAAAQIRLEVLERRNQKLADELQVAADARYREGLARQMGYVHKDELLYLYAEPKATPNSQLFQLSKPSCVSGYKLPDRLCLSN